MYVAQLTIKNFRHLAGTEIGPLPEPIQSEVVVLAGPNGGGKSSILELLSYALSNSYGFAWQMERTEGGPSFEVCFGLSEDDVRTIEERVRQDSSIDTAGVLARLVEHRRYYRAWDFPNGKYSEDSSFHEASHQLVSRCLGERLKPLFFRADRHYPRRSYDRNAFWNSRQKLQPGYFRNFALNATLSQYNDQMDFLVEQGYSYPVSLGMHLLRTEAGLASDPRPGNPLEPYQELFRRLFPEYGLAEPTGELRDQLYVRIPGGREIAFSDLSSGEQEAFFMLTYLRRQEVRDSMVFIDEPELHLHPELARRLIRAMVSMQPGNQLWLATHNPEVIDEAGRDRTYFLTRPSLGEAAVAKRAVDEEGAIELMRTLFGFSGYVGLARKVVFLEGDAASPDRRTFVQLFSSLADEIQFVPMASSDNALRINRAVLAVLGETVGHTQFYLIRDRDYLTDEEAGAYERAAAGQLKVLRRHEIENYLLQADAIKEVLQHLVGRELQTSELEALMHDAAGVLVGPVFKQSVAARLSRMFAGRDCSIGNFGADHQWIGPNMSWNQEALDAATLQFEAAVGRAASDVALKASPESIRSVSMSVAAGVLRDLSNGSWKVTYPGKEILRQFWRALGMNSSSTVLTNAIIRNLAANPQRIDPELTQLLKTISES